MNYKEIINLRVSELIDKLQELFKQNALMIKENNIKADIILLKYDTSRERNNKLLYISDENKKLTTRNNNLLDIHNKLLNVIRSVQKIGISDENDKLQNNDVSIVESLVMDQNTLFTDTVNGKILFNQEHPLFYDLEFKNKLMKYYIECEEYEKCAILKQI